MSSAEVPGNKWFWPVHAFSAPRYTYQAGLPNRTAIGLSEGERKVRGTLTALGITAALAAAVLAAPATANATATWSCTPITTTAMRFQEGTPVHTSPAGSSRVTGYLDDYERYVDKSCISDAGKQWWHLWLEGGYVYDGYRIG